ncbi:hypothetical protein SPFM1_00307 [Salmonella phage SPFM1]|nr:hypothetical protein SPFM1_00307 [Salmonella phage SPFM1]
MNNGFVAQVGRATSSRKVAGSPPKRKPVGVWYVECNYHDASSQATDNTPKRRPWTYGVWFSPIFTSWPACRFNVDVSQEIISDDRSEGFVPHSTGRKPGRAECTNTRRDASAPYNGSAVTGYCGICRCAGQRVAADKPEGEIVYVIT